jgi:PAS domain S-box-containing protein
MKNQKSTRHVLAGKSSPQRVQARPREAAAEDQRGASSRIERSEGLFRGLTENGLDSVAVLDKKGRVMYLSPSVERTWSRKATEYGKDPFGLVHPSEHARVSTGYARALRQPGVPLRAEYRVSHGDGSWRTVETVTTNMLSDPAIRGVVISFRDITERKIAEERLKKSEAELRLLSQEIFKVAEKERARVARDLHDQIGSELAFLQTKVSLMLNHMRRGQTVEAEASGLLALSEQIKGDCHRIVMTLGSTMIDDLGLMRSVEWYVEEFEKRTGIPCAADTAIDDVEMDKTVAMTAYRIVQEALTNVWKHSKASEARVEVSRTGKTLNVTVSDDGVGFDTQDHGRGRSLGLLSMAERAHLVGGKLRISSKIGKGTRVSARLPIDGRNSQREAST